MDNWVNQYLRRRLAQRRWAQLEVNRPLVCSVVGCSNRQTRKGLCWQHATTRASWRIKRKRVEDKRAGHIPN
jgi:hypothetical protein